MKNIEKIVQKYTDLVVKAERDLWNMPETGYFEYKTNDYMIKAFEKMGYELTKAENITGFYTVVDTGKPGPTVLVLAELDALICPTHPECDKETGAVHCCGHHVQCATMLGIASALKEKEVLEGLCGKIKLCVVPAEEGIEQSRRKELVKQGIIKYLSGKSEFIRRGYFNDVDIAFMFHASPISSEGYKFGTVLGHNGVIRKRTTFHGKSAHAGSSPHNGINALNAATAANMTINSLRETFREEDKIRIHSIITKGGSSVNAVPDEIIVESYIRGASVKALKETNVKVNRVIASCAAAFGANVTVEDVPGSEPMHDNLDLINYVKEVVEGLYGKGSLSQKGFLSSSTDMGDVSVLFPAIHGYAYGASGVSHGKDYYIVDPINACVNSAVVQVCLIRQLLSNNAEKAKQVMANYKPQFNSIEEFIAHKDSVIKEKTMVTYNDNGTIKLDF